jgi:hypothetical protein
LIGEGGVSAIPSDVLQRIASPEILSMLWHYLRAKRTPPLREDLGDTPLTTERSDTSIEGLLSRYQLQHVTSSLAISKSVARDMIESGVPRMTIVPTMSRNSRASLSFSTSSWSNSKWPTIGRHDIDGGELAHRR